MSKFVVGSVALAAALAAASPTLAGARLTAEGTEFVLITPDGRTMRSRDLVGAVLRIRVQGREIEVAIGSVEEDVRAVGGRVFLHRFEAKDRSGQPELLCSPDAEGLSFGFPLPDGRGGFDLTCTSGAVGKCVRWGYRPWEEREDGPPLRALHRACVHMVRADYGGDGHSATREGTVIAFCDRFGIHACSHNTASVFEAAWGVDGATCVARTRIAEIVSLEQLIERYPLLRNRAGARACHQDAAWHDPAALLFNQSGTTGGRE